MPKRSDDPIYNRKRLSNREGFRRLEAGLEKVSARRAAQDKVCDVCGRRCRAWRIVPATFGRKLGPTRASVTSGGLRGKFVVACDAGPDGCAAMLLRAGVDKEAVAQEEAIERMGLVLP